MGRAAIYAACPRRTSGLFDCSHTFSAGALHPVCTWCGRPNRGAGVAVPARALASGTVVPSGVEDLTRIRTKRLDRVAGDRTAGTVRAHGRGKKNREN